ncbi:DMT family transporter [Parasulfitobacter algicola]|uniref:DMT family transporter n=1 Tax=Parasulfitobacter algicola TaxID=2614809 RepID=A0ABX2INK2_9RHOB|nr:DMT family transporter [Sulfitobacter algicola]NSX54464.1 DMT family transporter [Sulfitobacter algicola]
MEPTPHNPPMAIALMLTATVFIAGTTLLAKTLGTDTLGPPTHPIQITFGRFAFAWLALVAMLPVFYRHLNMRPNLGLHAARTTCGAGGVTLMFAAVAFIPLSDATAISFLNPIFGMIFAVFFLSERVGPWRWAAAAIALIGAMILLRPNPDSFRPEALLALGAALALGLELIFIKKLSGREAPFQILLINNSMGLCLISVAVIFVWQAPTLHQWYAMVGVGVLMACAQICFVNAMKRADASFVVVFSYATLIFAALYDALIFDVFPDHISIIGACTILTGALLLAWREGRVRLSADSRA